MLFRSPYFTANLNVYHTQWFDKTNAASVNIEDEKGNHSWDVGMGVNFSALYAYYLASPFNWLLILCPKGLVIEFMTCQIVFKIGLSGLTMAYYLRKHCRTRDFGVAFFGIFYALSGYMAAYSWNIMWLDCIILFPLIVLGLEHLVKDGKGMLYCITLGLSILSNYYISIMTCIFMVPSALNPMDF